MRHAWIATHGVERIRNFELFAGPLVIGVGAIATVWVLQVGHGLGPLFATRRGCTAGRACSSSPAG